MTTYNFPARSWASKGEDDRRRELYENEAIHQMQRHTRCQESRIRHTSSWLRVLHLGSGARREVTRCVIGNNKIGNMMRIMCGQLSDCSWDNKNLSIEAPANNDELYKIAFHPHPVFLCTKFTRRMQNLMWWPFLVPHENRWSKC